MRLSIDHRTTYRFTAPQIRVVQLLRLTPGNSHDQTVASWRIDIDCDARLRPAHDGFGNIATMLYAEGPVDSIELAVKGEVLTSHSDGVVHGGAEPLPPLVFLRATDATPRDPAIIGWAATVAGAGDTLGRLRRVNAALHERFGFDAGRPAPGLDAAAAWRRQRVTARDLAQIMLVAVRSLGVPARFVSGYRLAERCGDHRPAPHAWIEAHVERVGWVGFDPCVGVSPREDYVRVAAALDAAGAAPVAGSRFGEGDEALEVDVQVDG